ncbi:1450_t:CDS:2, partial [Racocetra persica]
DSGIDLFEEKKFEEPLKFEVEVINIAINNKLIIDEFFYISIFEQQEQEVNKNNLYIDIQEYSFEPNIVIDIHNDKNRINIVTNVYNKNEIYDVANIYSKKSENNDIEVKVLG